MSALRAWQAQISGGAEVFPKGARVGEENTVVLLFRIGGLSAMLPCRVVWVDEDPARFAFAYGTLPGHPERGEVAFEIERAETADAVFRVVSSSSEAARGRRASPGSFPEEATPRTRPAWACTPGAPPTAD